MKVKKRTDILYTVLKNLLISIEGSNKYIKKYSTKKIKGVNKKKKVNILLDNHLDIQMEVFYSNLLIIQSFQLLENIVHHILCKLVLVEKDSEYLKLKGDIWKNGRRKLEIINLKRCLARLFEDGRVCKECKIKVIGEEEKIKSLHEIRNFLIHGYSYKIEIENSELIKIDTKNFRGLIKNLYGDSCNHEEKADPNHICGKIGRRYFQDIYNITSSLIKHYKVDIRTSIIYKKKRYFIYNSEIHNFGVNKKVSIDKTNFKPVAFSKIYEIIDVTTSTEY